MIYVLGGLILSTALAGWLAYNRHEAARGATHDRDEYRDKLKNETERNEELRHIISRMEEVSEEAASEKRKMREGDKSEQFEKTMDTLGGSDEDSGDDS